MATETELKTLGNEAYAKKDYDTAVKYFSEAIALNPSNHLLYSNRSACYAALRKLEEALSDGSKTIELNPGFWKGYTRKATPLYLMGRYQEAKEVYLEGMKMDPVNEVFSKGIKDCDAATYHNGTNGSDWTGHENPFAQMNIFTPETKNRIRSDPNLAQFLNDPVFVEKLDAVIENPSKMQEYTKDEPRLMQVFLAIMKEKLKTMGMSEDDLTPKGTFSKPETVPDKTPTYQSEASSSKSIPLPKMTERQPNDISSEMTNSFEDSKHMNEMDTMVDGNNSKAEESKAMGNAAYSEKRFDEALQHYSDAIHHDSTNILYYLNRSAVHFSMQNYGKCEEECDVAVEIGRTYKCDFHQIGKAFHRKGKALIKQKKYKEAVVALQKSLNEKRTANVLKDFHLAEKQRKKKEEEEYLDAEKSQEAKKKGNENFQKHLFPEAVKEYDEAIKRNPSDVTLYSNRAAAYTKLMAYDDALRDCEKCIQLDPKFIKGYTRKATVHFMMKNYHKAVQAYELAMQIDPNNADVISGYSQTLQKIQETRGDKDRTERAIQDPEIQEILREDQVQSVLHLFKNDPSAAQRAIQTNPELSRKFRILMNAGLV